eukprot:6884254-Lingulodinium_polyedra.AAC.1
MPKRGRSRGPTRARSRAFAGRHGLRSFAVKPFRPTPARSGAAAPPTSALWLGRSSARASANIKSNAFSRE